MTRTQSVWLSDQQSITHIDMLSEAERAAFERRMYVMYQPDFTEVAVPRQSHPILNQVSVRYVDNLLAQPS